MMFFSGCDEKNVGGLQKKMHGELLRRGLHKHNI